MTVICPACGKGNPEQFEFCGFCGDPLNEQQTVVQELELVPDRSARRSVTSLFVDLTNFTSASETTDPERIYRTIRSTLEKLAVTVKEVGGRVDRYYGDGFLATFGVPHAHEDDQYRALIAALQMQAQMEQMKDQVMQELQWEMKLRIGVTSGQVVSGQIDTGSKFDSSIFGHAVNLAKRLQSAARPGTILVDNEVYRKTQPRFIFRDPIELKLKGIDNLIISYELIREREDGGPKRGLFGRRAPLIGRDYEYRLLARVIERMHVGKQGMAALVLGEAGIGKTRLVEEVLPRETSGVRVIRSQGSAYGTTNYGFLKDAVRDLADISPEEDLEAQKAKLRDLLAFTGEIGREIKPTLYELVLSEVEQGIVTGTPQQHQQKIIAFVRHLFTQIALRQPLAILFDDIQWADSSSLVVVSHLIELIEEIPLSLIFIARSSYQEQLPAFFDTLREIPGNTYLELHLQPLNPDECDQLVDSLLEEMEVPPPLKNKVYERTEGNPLFIEELINIFLDQERFGDDEKKITALDLDGALIKEIPSTIHGLLLNRYDNQPKELKTILDMASVLGSRFHLPLLAAALQVPENELKKKIVNLENAGLIRKTAGLTTSLYSFRHALLQEIIYETILFEDRKRMHRRVAETLQLVSGKFLVDDHAVIGYHLERSGSREAASFLLQAGEESAAQYANQEAVEYFQRVQELEKGVEAANTRMVDAALGLGQVYRRLGKTGLSLQELNQALEVSRDVLLNRYRLGDIHLQLGLTYYEHRDLEEALDHFLQADEILGRIPEAGYSYRETDVEREIGWVYYRLGQLSESLERAERALELALMEDYLEGEGSAHSLLAAIHFREGKLDRAVQHAESSLLTREHLGDVWKAASSQTTLGHLYHQIGRWKDAEKMLRQAIYVQKEIGDFNTLAGSWTNLGLLLLDKGDWDEALVCMDEAIRTLPKHDFPLATTNTFYINRGSVYHRLGYLSKAINDFEKGLRGSRDQRNDNLSKLSSTYLAEAHLNKGNYQIAQDYINDVKADHPGLKEFQAEFYRIHAYILKEEKDFSWALEENKKAQKIILEIGNQYQFARLLLDEAEIQLAQFEAGERSLLESFIRENVLTALELFQSWGAEADKHWAEEVLYRVAVDELTFDKEGFQMEDTLVVVIDLNLNGFLVDEQTQESAVKLEKRLVDELAVGAKRENIYLIRSHQGFKYVMNYINHPSTRSDLANNSVEIALEAANISTRLLKSARTQYDLQANVQVGIALGTSPELIKDKEHASLFSSISKLGRRAQALAESSSDHQILITGDLTSAAFEAYELIELHDFDDRRLPDMVYQVGQALYDRESFQQLPGSSDRLVGRDKAMTTLEKGFEQILSAGQGHVIYLEAEAGMGKSRLLAEMIESYQDEVKILHGKCEAFRSSISYWPLIEILEVGSFRDFSAKRRLESILGISPLSQDDQMMIDNLPPEDLKKELFSRVRSLLLAEAKVQPVMLIFEDVHDLDLSSIELLDHLLPIIYDAPLSILIISRSEIPGPHRVLVKKAERIIGDRYFSIGFSQLDRQDSEELAKSILGVDDLPRGLFELLTPFLGHPLSIEESLRYLIEEGWLWKTDQGWLLIELTPGIRREMPNSFRDVLLRRLNFLDYESLHIVQAGSLLGEVFDRVTLSRVIPRSDLAQRLSMLCERGWLQTTKGNKPLRYKFNNTLVRESVYSTLLRSKKQLLHQRAGEALESLYPESVEENLELLTHHFEQSGIQEKTLYYAIRAAEKSADRNALEESQRYFRKARDILSGRKQTRSKMMMRVLLGLADVQLQRGEPTKAIDSINSIYAGQRSISETLYGACLRRLGAAVHLKGDLHRSLNIYTKASHELDRDHELQYNVGGKTIVSGREEYLETQLGLIKVHFDLQNYQETKQLAEEILDQLGSPASSEKAAELYNLLAGIAFQEGDLSDAQKQLEKSLAIYQAIGNRSGVSSIYANLGIMAANYNQHKQAENYFSLAVEMYQTLGDGRGLATIHNNLGQLSLEQGQLNQAIFHLEKGAEIARRSELTRPRTQALSNLGFAFLLSGDEGAARKHLEEGHSLAELFDYPDLAAETEWKLAALFGAQKKDDQARKLVDQSLSKARELLNQDLESHALRVLSRILRRKGEFKLALTGMSEAWEMVEDNPVARVKAGFAADYALCLAEAGKMARAREIKEKYIDDYELIEPADILRDMSKTFPEG